MVGTALSVIPSLIDAFVPRAQQTSVDPNNPKVWSDYEGRISTAGQTVNGQTALTLSGCWAATNTIAGLFGALPCKVYQKTDDGREERTKHDTHRLLSREPNPEMDSFVFWEMMTQWWVNYGNAFAEIQRLEDSDRLYALWPIHPTRVRPERTGNGVWTGRWQVANKGEQPNFLDKSEVFNLVGHLSDDGLIGKGVLAYAARAIGTGLAETEYKGNFFASGGRPSGVLEHPSRLSPDARAELRREWREVHGTGNETAVLWENMKYNVIGSDPDHAKLNDSQVFTVQEMCRFYDLPPHVLYELSKGTFANTEEMNRFLVSQSLNRRLVRVEKACDRQLFTASEKKGGYFTKFNVNALLRGDPKTQAEISSILIASGQRSVDEARLLDDMNKLPDGMGEHHWMKRDLATMKMVLETEKKLASQPLPDTPEKPPTPDTPPGTGKNEPTDRERKLSRIVGKLKRKLRSQASVHAAQTTAFAEEKQRITDLSEERQNRVETLETELNDSKTSIENRDAAISSLNEQLSATNSGRMDLLQDYGALLLTIDAQEKVGIELGEKAQVLEAERDATAAALANALATVNALTEDRNTFRLRLENTETSVKTLENDLSARDAELLGLKSELQNEKDAREADQQKADDALSRATKRGDDFKSRADTLSTDLGTARAECVTLRSSTDSLTKVRDELSETLQSVRDELKTARKEAEEADIAAGTAEADAQQRLEGARRSVQASMRALLDESLQFVLSQEAHEVRDSARKPDECKRITENYFRNLQQRIGNLLAKANAALEELGCKPVDVDKIAADYVAESRLRVNNVVHKTPKDDLRVAMRQEVEQWEGRKVSLVNWIGA